jgi:hypothetical protein
MTLSQQQQQQQHRQSFGYELQDPWKLMLLYRKIFPQKYQSKAIIS